ncbi:hypothetical protein BMETH_1706_0 [methanotrophic bacterial endosymbiont of Bathymodiolus sp.]|nr:hypothetical protein BMETH_1706_0 [methanotrophic bacterial endosymbiont of Bathymodiolus sp.]
MILFFAVGFIASNHGNDLNRLNSIQFTLPVLLCIFCKSRNNSIFFFSTNLPLCSYRATLSPTHS